MTERDIVAQLVACGPKQGQTVLVRSSLSSVGRVVGGTETVVRALLAAWLLGGGLGLLLDLVALLLVACGVSALLVVRRMRRSSGGPGL